MIHIDVIEGTTVESYTPAAVILPYEVTGEYYVEELGELDAKPVYSFFKRFFDIVLSLFALIVLLIPMLIIAVIVKLTSPGSVLYKQERLGKDGVSFEIIKFRSMYAAAESNGAQWSDGENDERITPFGKFLRRTRMDELPQFAQILTGKMSLVGPRPERECFYEKFETYIHGFSERLKVKPGLTGLAQVSGGYDLRPEEKVVYDIEYIKKRSLWLDLKCILLTVRIIFSHNGAR